MRDRELSLSSLEKVPFSGLKLASVRSSLIPLVTNFPEICAFIIGFKTLLRGLK